MTVNSVWHTPEAGEYKLVAEGADRYGKVSEKPDTPEAVKKLYAEYADGIRRFTFTRSAGSFLMTVSDKGVTVDFYAGASENASTRFVLR